MWMWNICDLRTKWNIQVYVYEFYETYVMRMWSARGWYVFRCEKMWTLREAYAKQVWDIN